MVNILKLNTIPYKNAVTDFKNTINIYYIFVQCTYDVP